MSKSLPRPSAGQSTLEVLRLSLALLARIPKTRWVTAEELHAQLDAAGIDRGIRTVQRLLNFLSIEYDIERDDRAKPYRYRWSPAARGLALPTLQPQEALVLALAQRQLAQLLPANVVGSLSALFDQARRQTLECEAPTAEADWLLKVQAVGALQPLLPPPIDDNVFAEVSQALFANLWLDVVYGNAEGVVRASRVMPLGLALQGERLYLVCRYEGFDNERNLALHRIHSAQASSLGFDRPCDFDLATYASDGGFTFGDGRRIRLSFKIDKVNGLHLLESRLSEDQQVMVKGNVYLIAATVVDSLALDWWLATFGDAVTDIRKEFVNVAL